MDTTTIAAIGGIVASGVSGIAVVLAALVRREVRSPNGTRTGELIAETRDDLRELRGQVWEHATDDKRHRR